MDVVDDFDEVVALVRQHGELFVRFSKGPAADERSGPSRDYEAEVDLPGLSVTNLHPEPWWPRPLEDWVARRMCKYSELGHEDGRFAWLLTGEEVGRGPDHEPLVVLHEPIASVGPVALAEAARRYRAEFRVGADSRG